MGDVDRRDIDDTRMSRPLSHLVGRIDQLRRASENALEMAQPIFELGALECVADEDDPARSREPEPSADREIDADEHERAGPGESKPREPEPADRKLGGEVRGRLVAAFKALADPTRRKIMMRLAQGEAPVTELAKPFGISLPAISKHIRVLQEAGLLFKRKEGRTQYCSLATEPLREIDVWMAKFRDTRKKVLTN